MVLTTTTAPLIGSAEDQVTVLTQKENICLEKLRNQKEVPGYCPGTWDGILCWDQTSPGQLSVQPCASYIAGFHTNANATRLCLSNGTWFFHEFYGKEWTNFSECSSGPQATLVLPLPSGNNTTFFKLQEYLPVLKILSQIGYGVSLISLVIAFIILATIKKLRCPRNMLHMHLFVSFIMRAFMALLKNSLFVMGVGLSSDILVKNEGSYFNSEQEENWECKLITTLWQYFILANYSWILMEGLYLHNLIFLALFSDTSAITMYVILGWGLPTLFIIPWAVCRLLLDNTLCWTTNEKSKLFLLIRVPTAVSIVLNFILFVNIIRVLLLKLRSSVCEDTKKYRRWAKSTLVLVPLFGVHYMIFLGLSYSIGVDETVELAWLFCDLPFASFQGFFVAVLYCFMNGEVRTELSRKWERISFSKMNLSCSSRDNMTKGILIKGRFPTMGRHNNPRGSCYSSTSFTSVSVVPNSNCCINKKRNALDTNRGISRAALHNSCHGGLGDIKRSPDLPPLKCYSNANDVTCPLGQQRRWSKSDYNLENEIELRSMSDPISSKNIRR